MRFAIVGAGAIGCLFGAKLSLDGNEVTLIHRDASVTRTIQRHGITLKESNGRSKIVHVPIRKGPAMLPEIEVLIVAVKAYDTKSVASSYRGRVDPETTIMSLQNGLGNVETLRSHFKNPLLAGSTTEGSLSFRPGRVVHTGTGSTIIGSVRPAHTEIATQIKATFDRAGFQTRVSSNIRGVLWTKAIINAAINPLSALTRAPNGALAQDRAMIDLGAKVIAEGLAVTRAERVKLAGSPRILWRRILNSTGRNKSSMLQDIENGRMTEIRELNGAIVVHAKRARVPAPVNEILVKLVLRLESSALHPMSHT